MTAAEFDQLVKAMMFIMGDVYILENETTGRITFVNPADVELVNSETIKYQGDKYVKSD